MAYPQAYHRAISVLIEGRDGTQSRRACAEALLAVRRAFGRKAAHEERYRMLYIAGDWPLKPGQSGFRKYGRPVGCPC